MTSTVAERGGLARRTAPSDFRVARIRAREDWADNRDAENDPTEVLRIAEGLKGLSQ